MRDELMELPEGWEWINLKDVAEKVGSGATPRGGSEIYKLSGIPLIRSMNVHFEGLKLDGLAYLDNQQADALKNVEVKADDVLLNITGASIGRVTQAPLEMDGARVNQHVCIIRTNPGLNASFLSKYLASPRVQRMIMAEEYGATRQALTKQMILDFDLPLPPLNEQKRIVAQIEALRERSQKAKAALEAIPELCDRFRQSVLAAAFRGDLTADWREENPDVEPAQSLVSHAATHIVKGKETGRAATINIIPGRAALSVGDPKTKILETWYRVPLSKIARLESGHTPSRNHPEYWDGEIPWIGILDAREHHGGYILTTRQLTNELGIANSAARLLPENTVCLSRTASVGYVVITGKPMATSQDFVNWICSDALLPEFLLYAFLAEGEHLLKFGKGTTHTTIYFPEVKAFHITLPPLPEQKEIVRRVKLFLKAIYQMEQQHQFTQTQLDRLNQSILAKAFRGELVEQDPNDEPASVLLERIRTDRAAQQPTKKSRAKGTGRKKRE